MLLVLGKAEPGQDARGARRRAMGVDHGEPLVNLADAVGIVGMLGFGQQFGAFGRRGKHGLERRRRAARRFLRDIADARTGRGIDAALVGLIDPGDHLEQGRFPGAVAADQADPGSRRQRRRGMVKDQMAAQAEGDAVNREHGDSNLGAIRAGILEPIAVGSRLSHPFWYGL